MGNPRAKWGLAALSLITSLIFANPVNATELTITSYFRADGLVFSTILTDGLTVESPKAELPVFQTILFETEKITLPFEPTISVVPTETVEIVEEPTPTQTPAIIETPTPEPTALPTTTTVQLSNGGLNADLLFNMSNDFRAARSLPAFQKDDRSCSLAASRAPEINAEIYGGVMHSGLRARNLPYWNTENIISMRTETEAFNWWVNDPPHLAAIVGNYTYSCVACSGNSCAQEFTNYQPK